MQVCNTNNITFLFIINAYKDTKMYLNPTKLYQQFQFLYLFGQVKEQTGTDICLDLNVVEVENPVVQHSWDDAVTSAFCYLHVLHMSDKNL